MKSVGMWIVSLLVIMAGAAGCGGDTSRVAGKNVASATTTLATTPSTFPPPTVPPRPTDELGMRCQGVVDELVRELKAAGKMPTGADVVCRDVAEDPLLATRGGYTVGLYAKVKYPWSALPEYQWDRGWRDVAAHEIGHTFATTLSDAQKTRFAEVTRSGSWNGEWYADYYAAVVGGVGKGALAYIGVPPPDDQVAVLCEERILPC